jgi:ABC-type glycerol-3-phosphate transport system substrate-binding protein
MKMLLSVLALALVSLVLAGCGAGAGSRTFEPGQEFSLAIGETAAIKGEDIEVTFMEVLEDSR